MSFITKRERVFSEPNNANLPPRGEGKLKAYSSCTDTRAWSHFMSDKTEHLIEIIKRNNEVCPGKYVPVTVIVEMMLASKTAEIGRLKIKISQLEQMLTAYDQLELSCDQKCEIALAHSMIKAAQKSLEELPPLDLNMSGITEITDSEGFLTGQSGGDDGWTPRSTMKIPPSPGVKFQDSKGSIKSKKEFKTVNAIASTTDLASRRSADVSTSANDGRVDDMKAALISKDAKLNALQNTIAVMENDVCEPYCLYAHIYTALEKIYATLTQNDKYRLFLNLMSSGQDSRCLDIKGKILFKLKVLEKFSSALLAPCSERFKYDESCECYYANVSTSHVEATFALTSAETKPPENKRAQLIADIMESDEMKELFQKNPPTDKPEDLPEDIFVSDTFSNIDSDNLTRLKHLQRNYEDLLACYENVKHERDLLKKRCKKYEEMDVEFEDMKVQLREYNSLYNERDYYRNRSNDLDSLKEQYLVLRDETAGLETQLKAETEINSIKSYTIDDLRSSNIALEQRLNEASIDFEKEKNSVLCKLKEAECKIMCQEQQIQSLAAQVDRLLAQDPSKAAGQVPQAAFVMDEIDDLRSQVKNLNDALYSSEDEKQQLQNQFETNLQLINDFRMEIENWKSEYDKARQRNEYLEKYSEGLKGDIKKLAEDVDDKNAAVANLMNMIENKSQEVNQLMIKIEDARDVNQNLTKNLQDLKQKYGSNVQELESEKNQILDSLKLAKKESKELLDKVKDYDELLSENEDITKRLTKESNSSTILRNKLADALEENKKLLSELSDKEKNNLILYNEIQRLREINDCVSEELKAIQSSKETVEQSYELKKKESEDLADRLNELKIMQHKFRELSRAHETLIDEKRKLEKDLHEKAKDLADAISTIQLTKKESLNLMERLEHSENLKEDMITLSKDYRKLSNDKQILQNDLKRKTEELDDLAQILASLKDQNNGLLQKVHKCKDLEKELAELNERNNELSNKNSRLQNDLDIKTQEINALYNRLEEKVIENRNLIDQVKSLERDGTETSHSLSRLQDINVNTQAMLSDLRKESAVLVNKLTSYENLYKEHEELKLHRDNIRIQNENLLANLKKIEAEKQALVNQHGDIMLEKERLEKALTDAREELIQAHLQVPYSDLVKEIENMKKEKIHNQMKIKDLIGKLEETDSIICNLSEDVLARDDRIAVLQNHINSLEDEVRRLHQHIEEALSTGEELRDNSIKKIDQSLNKMEAHHSKATHNMKMELAKLQNANSQLEEQITITKIKSNESFKNTHKYVSQIVHLQNEREILVTDIKQLELSCVGDTRLSPSNSSIEDILSSLDNVRKCIEARFSKSNCIEQTLLKVQTSSQLLLSKADEAKKLVEKEKLKIINEKEQAIADKINMEQQLLNLRVQLEEQTSYDKKIIDDLERELLNQKLIIDRLNQQTQSYISNLEDELKSLKNLYQNSSDKINQLKENTKHLIQENDKKDAIINKINTDLVTKSKEIGKLQNDITEFKNKPKHDRIIQVGNSGKTLDNISQTDKYLVETHGDELVKADDLSKIVEDDDMIMREMNNIQNKYVLRSKDETLEDMQTKAHNLNSNFDDIKTKYVDYKRKQLQPGKVESLSISGVYDEKMAGETTGSPANKIKNIHELYNSETNEATTSSNIVSGQSYKTNDVSRHPEPLEINKLKENDLFLIYKESETSHTDDKSKDKGISPKQQAILVETVAVQPDAKYSQSNKSPRSYKGISPVEPDIDLRLSSLTCSIDRSPGIRNDENLQLDITLPRVDALPADGRDSFIIFTHIDQTLNILQEPPRYEDTSDHLLTRVEADVLLLKNRDEESEYINMPKRKSSRDFGLEYLLYSVRQEYDSQSVRKSRSDSIKYYDTITEKQDEQCFPCTAHTCQYYKSKLLQDQSVNVNIDAPVDYEYKMQCLSLQLENTEKDYKKKLEAIKMQYDSHIKSIINDHNHGVNSIQTLHEETLQDIIKMHENEVESLRTMSIEAASRADRLVRENTKLQHRLQQACNCLDEEPIKISSPDFKKRRSRRRDDMKMLSKTKIEAFNVKPKSKQYGPCTCALEVNVSDTIRNIFEQVDVEQRKLAERAYLKFIANKILSSHIESLDIHELSFLHLKVCRTWKNKICKDEALQKKMDSLESQLLVRERSRLQHIADLDRDLVEQRRRLTEARNAVCSCCSPNCSAGSSNAPILLDKNNNQMADYVDTKTSTYSQAQCEVSERRSAGDLQPSYFENASNTICVPVTTHKSRRRTPLSKNDADERREKRMCDEPPTRLRRSHDGSTRPSRKP